MGANTRVAFHHSNAEGRESEGDEVEPRVLVLSVPQDRRSRVGVLQDRGFIRNGAPGAFVAIRAGAEQSRGVKSPGD